MRHLITRTMAATVIGLAGLSVAAPMASADTALAEPYQICLDENVDGVFYPYLVETVEDEARIASLPQYPFGNVACSGGAIGHSAPVECAAPVEVVNPIAEGRASRLQTKVKMQRAIIAKLRAKLRNN